MRPRRIVLLILAAAVFAISVWAVVSYRREHRLFDQAQWAAADWAARTRTYMVDDLITRRRLVGKTRSEVEALLGPPTETSKFANWDMVYVLGVERGFVAIDSEWLVLRLDKSGRVRGYAIVRD